MLSENALNPYVTLDVHSSEKEGFISNSITQSWTEQALECFEKKCDCQKCSISKGKYSFVCKMPQVIEHLLTSIGKPVY